jgi:hypothetical protein
LPARATEPCLLGADCPAASATLHPRRTVPAERQPAVLVVCVTEGTGLEPTGSGTHTTPVNGTSWNGRNIPGHRDDGHEALGSSERHTAAGDGDPGLRRVGQVPTVPQVVDERRDEVAKPLGELVGRRAAGHLVQQRNSRRVELAVGPTTWGGEHSARVSWRAAPARRHAAAGRSPAGPWRGGAFAAEFAHLALQVAHPLVQRFEGGQGDPVGVDHSQSTCGCESWQHRGSTPRSVGSERFGGSVDEEREASMSRRSRLSASRPNTSLKRRSGHDYW